MHAKAGDLVEVVEGHLVRVPVVVADAGRDDGGTGTHGVQQGWAAARVGAVMPDLQHVDPGQEPAFREQCLDRHLRVTGEQGRKAAAAQQANHRRVVNVALGQRTGHVVGAGVDEGDRRHPIQRQPRTCSRRREAPPGLVARLHDEARIGRVLVPAAGVQDQPDLVALKDRQQPGDVVLVRVGQDHDVDATLPPWQALAQASKEEIRVRPAVDQHRGARGRGHEYRVTLPDIEHDEVQAPVRQARQREDAEEGTGGNEANHRTSKVLNR